MGDMSRVTCHMSPVPVTSHMSLTPTVTATDPPSANYPTMHSRLVWEDLKKKNTLKIIEKFCKQIQCKPVQSCHSNFLSQSVLITLQKHKSLDTLSIDLRCPPP